MIYIEQKKIEDTYEKYQQFFNKEFIKKDSKSPNDYFNNINYNGSQLLNLNEYSILINFILNLSYQKIEARSILSKVIIINPLIKDMKLNFPEEISFKKEILDSMISYNNIDLLTRRVEFGSLVQNFILLSINEDKLSLEGYLTFETSFQAFFTKLGSLWYEYRSYYTSPIAGSLFFDIKDNSFTLTILNPLPLETTNFPFPPIPSKFLKLSKTKLELIEDFSNQVNKITQKCSQLKMKIDKAIAKDPFLEKFPQKVKKIRFDQTIEERIVFFLKSLFNMISDKNHGSILIFGYKKDKEKEIQFVSPNYISISIPFGRQLRWMAESFNEPYKEMIEEESDFKPLYRKLISHINTIVGLSMLDGAIIFNDNMDVIAAGVILDIDVKKVDINKGARHKSGYAFVKKTDTIAAVISQDGPISFYNKYGLLTGG